MNQTMAPNVETMFLPSIGDTASISSTMVREIVHLGGSPKDFVPDVVLQFLEKLV